MNCEHGINLPSACSPIRVQRGGADPIEYVDVSRALNDAITRQNHVIFGRRGCGKTLLLNAANKTVDTNIHTVYINCEDYKQHSFPNVLIEILDKVFAELEKHLHGWRSWLGQRRRVRKVIRKLRLDLVTLKETADEMERAIKEVSSAEMEDHSRVGLTVQTLQLGTEEVRAQKLAIEQEYKRHDSKIHKLDLLLPEFKQAISQFFEACKELKAIFIELDDFYHLARTMQPHVADYVHRLCKDVPLYFKIATLRHATTLYADRGNQPMGAQERHDFQPIDVDFTLADFKKTSAQLRQILYEFGHRARMENKKIDDLFRGEGFDRLVLASGGVPRDFLSLLLEALAPKVAGEERVGKDDVRLLSLAVFQRRIEELKADSEQQDQDFLMRGIYTIRKFCTEKQCNVFLVPDKDVQKDENGIRDLLNRLLDYRIIHSVGTALTHKSQQGTFSAYMIDIGSYANLRKLANRFTEIDVTAIDAREQCRNAPTLDEKTLIDLYVFAPADSERVLLQEVTAMPLLESGEE
jgi:hypothetical protein